MGFSNKFLGQKLTAGLAIAGFSVLGLAAMPAKADVQCATGWANVGGYCELQVTATSSVDLPAGLKYDIVLVGGGGGGGGVGGSPYSGNAGGGGGGEVLLESSVSLSGTVDVTIGAGGAGGAPAADGTANPVSGGGNGGSTTISHNSSELYKANGGFGAQPSGWFDRDHLADCVTYANDYGTGGNSGSGNLGGKAGWLNNYPYFGAGDGGCGTGYPGGGAGDAGPGYLGSSNGNGGPGTIVNSGMFTSSGLTLGGGGGATNSNGGRGGGGTGGLYNRTSGNGTVNTGGGGGGAGGPYFGVGGNGGSGLVVFRYTTPPGAPTNVTGYVDGGSVMLNWDAPTTGGPANNYVVTSSPAGASCVIYGTSAVCTGMTAGTTYTFSVQAENPAGISDPSSASPGIVAPVQSATPTISGITRVTRTVSATTDGWSAGVTFTYQWNLDGEPISGATSRNYHIANSDFTHWLTVSVTGTLAGFDPVTLTSDSSLVGAAVVTITGNATYDQTLYADPGIWPAGTTLSYQWRANKDAIGNDSDQYYVTADNVQKRITVAVSGVVGGRLVTKVSKPTRLVLLAKLPYTPTPYVSGDAYVNGWVCADTDYWGDGVDTQVQWYRNGHPIDGETGWCYQPGRDDYAQMLNVKVTGSKYGYIPLRMTSNSVRIVAQYMGWFNTPIVQGDAVVGNNLTVDLGNIAWWGANLSYQWLDNGRVIGGATSDNYTIPAKKRGHSISVRVTISYPYYETQKLTSDQIGPVTR